MRTFLKLTVINAGRALFSVRFLLSCFGTALVLTLSFSGELDRARDVIYLIETGVLGGGGLFIIISGIIPLFPFASTYAIEWEEKAVGFWFIRTGVQSYAISKIIVSALSGFLTTAIGMLVCIIPLALKFPLVSLTPSVKAYRVLVDQGKPWLYIICIVTHIALTSTLFAVAALWFSALFPNRFATVASPMVIYLLLHRLIDMFDVPPYLKPVEIIQSIYDAGTPGASILLKGGLVIALSILMGMVTVPMIRWRLHHE